MKRTLMWGTLIEREVRYGTEKPQRVKVVDIYSLYHDKRTAARSGEPVRVLVVR